MQRSVTDLLGAQVGSLTVGSFIWSEDRKQMVQVRSMDTYLGSLGQSQASGSGSLGQSQASGSAGLVFFVLPMSIEYYCEKKNLLTPKYVS